MNVCQEALGNFKRIFAYNERIFAYNVLEKCITVYREKYNSLQAEIKNAKKYIEYSEDDYVSIYKRGYRILQLEELIKDDLEVKDVTSLEKKLEIVFKLHGFLKKISTVYGPSVILTNINDMAEYIETELKIATVLDNTGYNIKF